MSLTPQSRECHPDALTWSDSVHVAGADRLRRVSDASRAECFTQAARPGVDVRHSDETGLGHRRDRASVHAAETPESDDGYPEWLHGPSDM